MTTILPDIDIPYSASKNTNLRRYGDATDRCLLCGRPIDLAKAKAVLLEETCGQITHPHDDQEHTGGCFFIGPDCWKRQPQLHPYEIKDLPKVVDRITLYTTAPAAYDGFSTREVRADAGRDNRGLVVREVSLEPRDLEWQTGRYASGLHAYTTPADAARFPSIWQING